MNRTEQIFMAMIKKLRSKGYDARNVTEEDGSISLVINACIDTVRCNVLLWAIHQQLENWRVSHKLNTDNSAMTFKFNHNYPLNSFDARILHNTIMYAIKCVPYAANENNKIEKENQKMNEKEKILEGKLKVIAEMLRCKGFGANYKVNNAYVVLEISATISTNLDALLKLYDFKYPKWTVSIDDKDDTSIGTILRFARFYPLDSMDMQVLYDTLQYKLKDIPDVEVSTEDVVNVLKEKGYCVTNFTPGKIEIYIALANLSSEETNYISDTLPDGYRTDCANGNYIIWSNSDIRAKSISTTIKDLYFWALSLEENKEDTKMTTINEVVDALRKKGHNASVCDEKSFYVSRSDIMKAPKLPSGWVIDVASSSWLALRIINYDITNDSLKDLMQWVEQIPHGSSALVAGAFNYNSPNANLSMYPGMANPFELFGMGANNFTVNNVANIPSTLMNFSDSTKVHKPGIYDVMNIISDENGELDVQKAKEVFGSYKKALKALFKYCKECIPANIGDNDSEDMASYEARRSEFISVYEGNNSQDFEQ